MPSEPPSNMAGLLAVAVVLLILSCLFSMSESAFLSVNKLRIRFLRRKKVKKAIRVGKLLDKQEELINTILIGNNIVNISISSILTKISLELFGNAGVAAATFVVTILLLIFGEITPKSLGSRFPEKIAFGLSGFLTFCFVILRPLVFIFTKISDFAKFLTGSRKTKIQKSFTEEEIKTFIEVGEEEGTVEKDEKEMLHKVFKFTDLEAKDIMQPRTKMVTINLDAKYQDIIGLSEKTHLSHFPVTNTNIDDICGILHLKDALPFFSKPETFSVKSVMKKPLFIPETKKMSSIQEALRESNQSIAIVLDEYSGTAGLLTIDDISSEIFGTLSDEYDFI
ncbi:MAG: CNNM domain-containing protein, partial [Treponemataceae bacterium]|nr:CNNM domain-containing protein [Treponemataceae bacterium]